jgi:DNA-binding MarR family transcriptional regulator
LPADNYFGAGGDVDTDDVARLRIALARTARWLERQSTAGELSRTQLSVLGTVARLGPLGLGRLAEIEGVNPTMLSRIVAKLDDAGLVHRTPDPADRRAAHVEVTDTGLELHLRMRAERTRLLVDRLADLTPEHRDRLLAALPAIEVLAGPAGGTSAP